MKTIVLGILILLFCGCSDGIEFLSDDANSPIENGLKLTLGKPEKYDEVIDFLPITFTNLSNDTIHFDKFFLISIEFPDGDPLELFIVDQNGVNYKAREVQRIRCFGPMPEPFSLPPSKSHEQVLSLSLKLEYGLETGKIYNAFVMYRNLSTSTNVQNHTELIKGRPLWHGIIKSNTIRFKYSSTLRKDLQPQNILKMLLQAISDE
jgi:hypothetical protein